LQEKLVLLGANHVFGQVPILVESLLGITVCQSQVYRSVQAVSETMEDPSIPSPNLCHIQAQVDKVMYAMMDGSFVFMDDGWREVKVGRCFTAEPDPDTPFKWKMENSEYVAQRGHYEDFTTKFELLLPPTSVCKKVFVTDGAIWITNWITRVYPDSLQILDFYHVCEKLASISELAACEKEWFDQQKVRLLAGQVASVCDTVRALKRFDGQPELLSYLEKNAFRMQYEQYRKDGLMISSGPIESAHRTVLQVRMKRSGQRWSDAGCDAMVKLRIAYRSGKSSLITNALLKQAA
jgi:hypothetical protein